MVQNGMSKCSSDRFRIGYVRNLTNSAERFGINLHQICLTHFVNAVAICSAVEDVLKIDKVYTV